MEIITKSIQELRTASEVKDDTELAIQRVGSTRAEKTNIESLSVALSKTKTFASIKSTADASGLQMQQHLSSSDPHGDRAFASDLISSHLQGDPHGSNAYTDDQLAAHTSAYDPHGSNAFAENRYQQHIKDFDPHGDRLYTDTLLEIHNIAEDPHGDRYYTDYELETHSKSTDPHGDREYSDKQLKDHENATDPHSIIPIVTSLIEAHDKNNSSHNFENRLNTITNSVDKQINTKLLSMVGDSIAPLVNGEVPSTLYKNFVKVEGLGVRPTIGERGVLYLDEITETVSYWDGSRYLEVRGSSSRGEEILTTDLIEEGERSDKRFFTQELEDRLNSKISSVNSTSTDNSLLAYSEGTDILFKTLIAEGDISLKDIGSSIIIGNTTHPFKGKYDESVRLTTNSSVLENVNANTVVSLKGTIAAKNYEVAENNVLVNDYSTWDVEALFMSKGSAIGVEKPRNVAISTNGLVVSGFAVPASFVKAYDFQGQLIGEATTQVDGGFTITCNRAILDGSLILLYVFTEDLLVSEPLYFYSKNRQIAEYISAVSFNKEGNKIRGRTARGATVIVTDQETVELGRAITTDTGNFDITLNKTLLDRDIINITANVDELLFSLESYSVGLKDITVPYDIVINHEGTVLKGKAEPLSKIIVGGIDGTKITSTNAAGEWKYTAFSDPFTKEELAELPIMVMQEDRQGTVVVNIETEMVRYNNLPITNKKTTTANQIFEVKNIKRVLGQSALNVDIGYDKITKQLYIEGINTTKNMIDWAGDIKIIREDIEVQ